MRHNIVIAGVGGQGILTIARVLSTTAVRRGLNVKQSEVHGMSQRGGAVYSHLRISDSEIFSDMIPAGHADMILAIEPLEALRYVPMLRKVGTIVASTNAEVNIPDYPQIETVLSHLSTFENHIAIDMALLARAAGGVLSANIVALGAASIYLGFSMGELQEAVEELFGAKGERVVQTNLKALRFGHTAAMAYREALLRGASANVARGWISTLSADHLASEDDMDFSGLIAGADQSRLTGAEAHAFESLLMSAYTEGRRQLYEHEVYRLVELVGAIIPPRHTFVPKESTISEDVLANYPGSKVVLKLVSSEIVHKSDSGAVLVIPKEMDRVRSEISNMIARHSPQVSVAGVLVVEFVEHDSHGLGSELFVGIRATREFGPVIAAGLGGVQTEYLAAKMLPGVAVAKAVAQDVDAEEFLEMFKKTAAYDVLSGRIRGVERSVSDGELLRCFRAFISIARQFCVDRGMDGPDIGELEVNPFAFTGQRLVPLDGRGSLRPAAKAALPRPLAQAQCLLEPCSIALVGISSNPDSFGRIMLENILSCGFDRTRIAIIKPDVKELDGIPCIPRIEDLEGPIDLLIVALPAQMTPEIVDSCNGSGKVRSGIIISGGAGETEDSKVVGDQIRAAAIRGRSAQDGGAVFLGPNCMGVRSLPGHYDTFFIDENKLPPKAGAPQPVAIISQSGAFIVSRLSSQTHLNPAFAVSIGNQCDLTASDLLRVLADRNDVQVLALYLEGFSDLDGLEAVRAVAEITAEGKSVVIYKAGRTESGRSAAAGHTASVAGDYDVCTAAMRHAGAFVAEDFREFGQAVDLATCLLGRCIGAGRVFAVTNAGMEAVAMADAGLRFEPPSSVFGESLRQVLSSRQLDRLVDVRNPLDITPTANEAAYDDVVCAALNADEVDAVVVSCVPLAPSLRTLAADADSASSFVHLAKKWLAMSTKPVLFVLDSGPEYDELANRIRRSGMAVFRSADEAARLLLRMAAR